jgi:hypothetical protein
MQLSDIKQMYGNGLYGWELDLAGSVGASVLTVPKIGRLLLVSESVRVPGPVTLRPQGATPTCTRNVIH